jgi:tight adherence protein C
MGTSALIGVLSLAAAMAIVTHLVVGGHRRAELAEGVDVVDADADAGTPHDGTHGGTHADAQLDSGVAAAPTGRALSEEERLRRQQIVAAAVAGALAAVAVVRAMSTVTALAAVILVVACWYAPVLIARRREHHRRVAVDHELVDAMAELVMAVEAGLSLDAAMARYARERATPLAVEFGHYLDLVRLGRPRPEALDELVQRTPTGVMHLFVAAATQNQRLGTPLAAVLRDQAATARRQRRQAFEEQAAKVPLKMVFPTVFCVLPVLMIVAVGPAALRLLGTLPG